MHRCFALLLIVLAAAFGRPGAAQPEPVSGTLTVFAAASLADAFEAIAADFEAAHPGTTIRFSFAGSSSLAAQLAEGAPADVFASASTAQMTAAREAGRIAGRPRTFARNRLIVAFPADNPAALTTLHDLAAPGLRLVVAAPGVPVRTYTDAMLEALAAAPAFGPAWRDAVVANIVSEEENVRQVAAKVALGEADAGIVYVSDVTPDLAEAVGTLSIPDAVNTLATYPIAITNDTANIRLARAFVRYVLAEAGQETLACWNFIPVRAGAACPA
jgi:molybdate transport system substrate-binding protein